MIAAAPAHRADTTRNRKPPRVHFDGFYAVVWIDGAAVLYVGKDLFMAACALVPGTVHGHGATEDAAIYAATRQAAGLSVAYAEFQRLQEAALAARILSRAHITSRPTADRHC